jgi:hypothetical protein
MTTIRPNLDTRLDAQIMLAADPFAIVINI